MNKTGIPVNSTIWPISTYAASVWRNKPILIGAGIRVLSTTTKRHMIAISLFQSCFVLKFNVFVHSFLKSTISDEKLSSGFFGRFSLSNKDVSLFVFLHSFRQFDAVRIFVDQF